MALSDKKVPDNFHAHYEPAVRVTRGVTPTPAPTVAAAGVRRLSDDVGAVAVHLDEATHLPVSITVPPTATRTLTMRNAGADHPTNPARRPTFWRGESPVPSTQSGRRAGKGSPAASL